MNAAELIALRLQNQQLSPAGTKKVGGLVAWMGVMQAQDYGMAKWAIGMRIPSATDKSIEEAINSGKIIRTHILRPTWHFVASQDVRWLFRLAAPHMKKALA